MKEHKRVLDKHGKPDDIPVGIKNVKEPLPHMPLSGMYNKSGGKVRLTFKLEVDQIWLGTKGLNNAYNNNIYIELVLNEIYFWENILEFSFFMHIF